MQESNFEKDVQQKMDELALNPSAAVWQKVADAIDKRKDNRRVFVIVLLALLFAGSAVFVLLNQRSKAKFDTLLSDKIIPQNADSINKSKSTTSIEQFGTESNNPNNVSENRTTARTRLQRNNSAPEITGDQQTHLPEKSGMISRRKLTASKNSRNAADRKVEEVAKNNSGKINYNTRPQVNMNVSGSEPVESDIGINTSIDTGKTNMLENDKAINNQVTDTITKVETDIGKRSADTIALDQKPIEEKKVDVGKPGQSKPTTKWEIGFNFSVGFSATKSSYLGVIGVGSTDESKAFDLAQSNTGTTGSGIIMPYTPSEIKSGAGVIMGVFMQKAISPKTHLQLGLNYRSYNSSMQIGSRVDSTPTYGSNLSARDNFFYRAGTNEHYKNHFHFIELPVSIRVKLGKQNKLPIYVNTGFTISQLITTNALQFDSLSGSYYGDNTAFNKTQFNISVGLLFSLTGNNHNPLLIGPDLNFSLTKMANSGIYKDRHYSYIGIQVRKGFGKK